MYSEELAKSIADAVVKEIESGWPIGGKDLAKDVMLPLILPTPSLSAKERAENELLPCPWCGQPARFMAEAKRICCDNVDCPVTPYSNKPSQNSDEAVKAWNTRAGAQDEAASRGLPTDEEVAKWYADNIDEKIATVSSSIYKFRLWLNDRIK